MSLASIKRRHTRAVRVGNLTIGGDAMISIQSMTKTDTRDVDATVNQIEELARAGCDIVRVAVSDMEAAEAFGKIRERSSLPLVADIHFDYRLALKVIELGADKLRINPGNIGSKERIRKLVEAAAARNVPIRIGVNAGSLEKRLLEKYRGPTAEAMIESAADNVRLLEDLDFFDIVVSLKAFDVLTTLKAYQIFSDEFDYPLHVGITEAGTLETGAIRSSVGIGAILLNGIGDTIRVSLTGPPSKEVDVGYEILRSLNLRQRGPTIVSCPTCGRCEMNIPQIAQIVTEKTRHIEKPIKIAIMGCVVNGPGEAKDADIGIAGGRGVALLFKAGEPIRKIREENVVEELLAEIEAL